MEATWRICKEKITALYNPYKWKKVDLSYYVLTDNQIPYRLYFEDETARFGEYGLGYPIASFSIEVEGHIDISQIPEDPRLADTVQSLLAEYFQDDENTLVVVYDTLDGRGEARKRKFNQWFVRFSLPNVEKRDYVIIEDDVEMPNSLFIHANHPFKDLIVGIYQNLVNNGGYL